MYLRSPGERRWAVAPLLTSESCRQPGACLAVATYLLHRRRPPPPLGSLAAAAALWRDLPLLLGSTKAVATPYYLPQVLHSLPGPTPTALAILSRLALRWAVTPHLFWAAPSARALRPFNEAALKLGSNCSVVAHVARRSQPALCDSQQNPPASWLHLASWLQPASLLAPASLLNCRSTLTPHLSLFPSVPH